MVAVPSTISAGSYKSLAAMLCISCPAPALPTMPVAISLITSPLAFTLSAPARQSARFVHCRSEGNAFSSSGMRLHPRRAGCRWSRYATRLVHFGTYAVVSPTMGKLVGNVNTPPFIMPAIHESKGSTQSWWYMRLSIEGSSGLEFGANSGGFAAATRIVVGWRTRSPTLPSFISDSSAGRMDCGAVVSSSKMMPHPSCTMRTSHSRCTMRAMPDFLSMSGMPPTSSGMCCEGMKTNGFFPIARMSASKNAVLHSPVPPHAIPGTPHWMTMYNAAFKQSMSRFLSKKLNNHLATVARIEPINDQANASRATSPIFSRASRAAFDT